MISTETQKFILRLILAGVFYSPLANAVCDSRLRLYTEIGCQPVYGNNNSNDCPVAYNCENVFSRPNDKCYSNGNVYEPGTHLNKSDILNYCLSSCYCDTRSYKNITVTKFHCVDAECPSDFYRPDVNCYNLYDKDLCCATDMYCPEEKEIVHECTYNGKVYNKGQRIKVEGFSQCVCSESFNGTFNDGSCRKLGCNIELRYLDKILNWNAPIFFEKADGCPVEWFYSSCDSNKRVYTEIGCQPIYGNNDSNDCPVAYDCENVFTRPNDKCYFNGNVYEPRAHLSKTDSVLNPCLASCFCDQRTYNNITETKFKCARVECPSKRPAEPCYFRYDKDKCCKTDTYCPDEKTIVHECTYSGNVYKQGERIYIDDFTQCVCSESFNGTFNDGSCRKISCKIEIIYIEKILKWSAPIFYEKADGCPIEWYNSDHDRGWRTPYTTSAPSETVPSGPVCRYGNLRFPVGQNITIGGVQSDSDTYKTTCSCSVPPLVTCIKTKLN